MSTAEDIKIDEAENNSIASGRSHRKLLLACGAVVAVIAVCGLMYYVNAHSRYKVVGKVDPVTGYRIEYTVSSRYRKAEPSVNANVRDDGEAYNFRPSPPPKALQWILTHVFRKSATSSISSTAPNWSPGTVKQYYFRSAAAANIKFDPQGYPFVPDLRKYAADVLEEHMLVCGFPATWCCFGDPVSKSSRLRFCILFFKPKDPQAIYAFGALDDITNPTGAISEVLKIRNSIRIVKVR